MKTVNFREGETVYAEMTVTNLSIDKSHATCRWYKHGEAREIEVPVASLVSLRTLMADFEDRQKKEAYLQSEKHGKCPACGRAFD